MEHPILVTAAIIKKNDKYLITQRPNDGRHKGSFWEFPGGKLKVGENPRAGLEREILEELGIKIKAGKIFEISSHIYDETKHIILLGFYCEYISGDIRNLDINSHAWVTSKEMENYDFCEADLIFIEKLKNIA
jgi:8-oxo-dGTP diphosphatase